MDSRGDNPGVLRWHHVVHRVLSREDVMSGRNGKGDLQRPMSVTPEVWAENWERAFGSSGSRPLAPTHPANDASKRVEGQSAEVCRHPADGCYYSPYDRGIVCGTCGDVLRRDNDPSIRRGKPTLDNFAEQLDQILGPVESRMKSSQINENAPCPSGSHEYVGDGVPYGGATCRKCGHERS